MARAQSTVAVDKEMKRPSVIIHNALRSLYFYMWLKLLASKWHFIGFLKIIRNRFQNEHENGLSQVAVHFIVSVNHESMRSLYIPAGNTSLELVFRPIGRNVCSITHIALLD